MKIYNITEKEYESYGRVLTEDYKVDALNLVLPLQI